MASYQPLEPVLVQKLGLAEFSALQSQLADLAPVLFGAIIFVAMMKFFLAAVKWNHASRMEERITTGGKLEGDSFKAAAGLKTSAKSDIRQVFFGIIGIAIMMMALSGVLHPSASDLKAVEVLEQELRPHIAQASGLLEQALQRLAQYIPW